MRAKYTLRTNLTICSWGFRLAGRMPVIKARGRKEKSMKGISFVEQKKLNNVAGRINYISSEARQENLYSVYETAPREFWRELAKENQEDFARNGTSGQCIEARELIIALPKSLFYYDHDELLKFFVENFKDKYGVECIAALHHNKRRTNFHIHLIYSEREKLPEPVQKIAARDRYYAPDGSHVRTKKEAVDENGKLLPGYKKILKGMVYEEHLFEKKKPVFKSLAFLDEAKGLFTELMNSQLSEKEQMRVFPKNSPYIPTKKIGKNNPRAAEIQKDNNVKDEWNKQVRRAVISGAKNESLIEIKRQLIIVPVSASIKHSNGAKDPITFRNIVARATSALSYIIKEVEYSGRGSWAKVWGEALDKLVEAAVERVIGARHKSKAKDNCERNKVI